MAADARLPSTEVLAVAEAPPRAAAVPTADAEARSGGPPTVRQHLRVLVRHRWLGLTCLGTCVGVAVIASVATPRRYTASAKLLVTRQSSIQLRLDDNVLHLDDDDRDPNAVSTFLETQVAALKSRDLAARVVRSFRLADNAAFMQPEAGRAGLFAVADRAFAVFRPRNLVLPPPPADDGASSGPVPAELIDRYLGYLSVQAIHGTDLVEVDFATPHPELSAFLAAAHADAYLQASEEARLATNLTAKDFLGRQLDEARARVERAQAALNAFATEHPNVAVNQEQQLVVQRIAELSTVLTKAEAARVAFETRYEFLTRPGSEPLAYFLDRPGVQKLHLSLLDLRAARLALAERAGPNHPQMITLRRHEAEVEQQLADEVAKEMSAVRTRYETAREREDALRRKLAALEQSAVELRDLGMRYELLKTDLQTANTLHDSLLQQRVQTAVNSQLGASNVRLLERPEVPRRPSEPNVPLILTVGLVGGTLVAVGACFVCEHLDRSLKSERDVEQTLKLPVLATIGRLDPPRVGLVPARTAGELVVVRAPDSPVAEAFRGLRSALLFSGASVPPKVILTTSAEAGEGKTLTCLNLAAALAETGARVLLIDADLRHPACHGPLGVANDRGLSTFLTGGAALAGLVRVLDTPSVAFIPAGPAPLNPGRLLGSRRLRDALEEIAEAYDFVLLDSPPVRPVTDALVLGREADGVVLVLRGHDTPRELAQYGRDRLLQAGVRLLGVVVNGVDRAWGDLYLYRRYDGRYYPTSGHSAPAAADVHA